MRDAELNLASDQQRLRPKAPRCCFSRGSGLPKAGVAFCLIGLWIGAWTKQPPTRSRGRMGAVPEFATVPTLAFPNWDIRSAILTREFLGVVSCLGRGPIKAMRPQPKPRLGSSLLVLAALEAASASYHRRRKHASATSPAFLAMTENHIEQKHGNDRRPGY